MKTQSGPEYDAIIVGARVAGATLALQLARQGRRVLLVDRDRFPSDTLSTHAMSAAAVALLAKVGALEDVLAAGFRRITRHRTWIEDCCLEAAAGPPGAFSLAPRRSVLDSTLIAHAVRAGAEFRERTRADGILEHDGRVTGVALTEIGGARCEAHSRVVVGADGKHSRIAEWVGAEKYREVPGMRPGYYGYFRHVTPREEPTMEIWFGREQIGFIFPMRPDEDCIALEVRPEDFESFRRHGQREFEERVRQLPGMESRMRDARLEGKLMGIRSVDNYFRQPYGPGWALTGDAGYLKDPSTGLGIGDAMLQSMLLAEALEASFGGAAWDAALGEFHRRRDEAVLPYYEMTLGLTSMPDLSPAEMALVRSIFASPALARTLTSAVPTLYPQAFAPGARSRVEATAKVFLRAAEADSRSQEHTRASASPAA
jgi:flavin-dependent dehydrogenase